jgi:hypothetical protein
MTKKKITTRKNERLEGLYTRKWICTPKVGPGRNEKFDLLKEDRNAYNVAGTF